MMIENKYPTKRDEPITNHTARKAHLIPITSSSSRSPSSSWSWSSSSTSQRWQSLPFPWLLWAHPPSPGIRHLLSRHPAIMMMKVVMKVMMLMMTMINDENQGIYLCKTEWIWILKDVSSRSLFCEGVNVSNNSDQSDLRIQFGKLRRDICDKNGDNQWSQTEEHNQWPPMCIHRPR